MSHDINSDADHELIVSGIHLKLTPALKTFVREKSERLFRHMERIVRIRVELECDLKEAVPTRFKAKGHIVIHGPDMNAAVAADECHKAVSRLIDKLDRMLARRHHRRRGQRQRLNAVKRDADLLKAVETAPHRKIPVAGENARQAIEGTTHLILGT